MANGNKPGKTPGSLPSGPGTATPPGQGGGTGTGPGKPSGPGKGGVTPKGDDRPPQTRNISVR